MDLNIKFEYIPERWPDIYYYWFFGKRKNYHYPTDDDIKFFYFTLFKKNGFIYLILLIRKYICLFYKYRKYTLSIKYIPILIIIMFNNFLNILFNFKKKKKWYF